MSSTQYYCTESELHNPLIYGDYYFLELIYKLCNPQKAQVNCIESVRSINSYISESAYSNAADSNKESIIKKEELTFWIEKHFNKERLSLKTAARHFGFSESYFSKMFKSIVGQNFYAFLEHTRLTHAQSLLKQHIKVEEVGYQCGYDSSRTFRRAYKRYFGVNPGSV